MTGVIRLFNEKLAGVPGFVYHCFRLDTPRANRHGPVCLYTAFCL
jgi:hypothetical protein